MKDRTKSNRKGILLGYHSNDEHRGGIGFHTSRTAPLSRSCKPIEYSDEGHLMTIAPTGSGKGVSSVIPTLLTYPGSIVVVDPKGEAAFITARCRRAMGQQVVFLDPFGVVTEKTDGFNPLDIVVPGQPSTEDDARAAGNLLIEENSFVRDKFWVHTSSALLGGLVLYLAVDAPQSERRLSRLRELFAEDFSYVLACLLDSKAVKQTDAAEEFAIFLQMSERETRPSVQATAQQHVRHFGSPAMRRATDNSTFDWQEFVQGKPMTIYMILPPSKLESHANVLRLWIGTLMMALSHRKKLPDHRTLFIIDEAAQLGTLNILKNAITLFRGYGVQMWCIFQDAAQLMDLYPSAWPAMVNNCSVLQLFGARNYRAAEEFARLIGGITPETFLKMKKDEQVLLINGGNPILCTRNNYLKQPLYRGLYDANPMYGENQKTP